MLAWVAEWLPVGSAGAGDALGAGGGRGVPLRLAGVLVIAVLLGVVAAVMLMLGSGQSQDREAQWLTCIDNQIIEHPGVDPVPVCGAAPG